MENSTIINSLEAGFQSLPDPVKDWLASEKSTLLILEINKRLGLKGEKRSIIPLLILRLAVQDLDPRDFINELSHELDISFQSAKIITEEISDKILRPIETELRRDVGVDIQLIYFGQPGPRKTSAAAFSSPQELPAEPPIVKPLETPKKLDVSSWLKPPAPQTSTEPPKPPIPELTAQPEKIVSEKPTPSGPRIDLRKFQIRESETDSAPKATGAPEPAAEAPFLLHQETPTAAAPRSVFPPQPLINLRVQNPEPEKPSAPKAISVRLETPKSEKIVHYSDFRTPLNQFGGEKKPATKKGDTLNLPTSLKPNKNVVDLRNHKF